MKGVVFVLAVLGVVVAAQGDELVGVFSFFLLFFSSFFFSLPQEDTSPEAFVKQVFPRSLVVQRSAETLPKKAVKMPEALQVYFTFIQVIWKYSTEHCQNKSIGPAWNVCLQQAYPSFFEPCRGQSGVCVQEVSRQMKVVAATFSNVLPITTFLTTRVIDNDLIGLFFKMPFYVVGQPGFFALMAFFVFVVAIVGVFLVLAVRLSFWTEKKQFLALLLVVVVGSSIAASYWTLVSTGFQNIGFSPDVPNVSLVAVNILGRVASVIFLLLFALFTWMLISAVVESFFPERRKLSIFAMVCLVLVALGTAAYSIAMIVIQSKLQWSLTIDASAPLLAGVSLLFSSVLALMCLLAWRLVDTKRAEMRRNAILFFAGSSFLAAVFLVSFIVSLLELTVDYFKYNEAATGLNIASTIFTVLAVLGYTGAAVIGAMLGKSKREEAKTEGYVPLKEPDQVPARYKDF